MKKNYKFPVACVVFAAVSLFTTTSMLAQNVGINGSGAAPAASAMLDVDATNKGLLVPRVALTATNAAGPVAAPATSLLIYNTATAGVSPNNVIPGYYYWDGAKWVALGGSGGRDWSLLGNGGTNSGTNFVGTTDAQHLQFRTNNTNRMRIMNSTYPTVGIGTSFPVTNLSGNSAVLHVHDGGSSIGSQLILSTHSLANGERTGLINFAATQATNDRRSASIESYLTAASATNVTGDLRFFTNNNNTFSEKMRIFSDGRVAVNSTGTFATSTFYSAATGNNNAVDGDAAGTGDAVYGQNTGTGNGVSGLSSNSTGFGVNATNVNASGTGLIAIGNSAAGGYATAGSGGAFTGTRIGVYSVSLNTSAVTSSTGVIGRDAGGTFTMLTGGAGVTGVGGSNGVAMFAYNSGTGNALYANNDGATSFAVDAVNDNTNGTGIIGSGNGVAGGYLGIGSGVAGTGSKIGVYGEATSGANGDAGGYFVNGASFAYVAARSGWTNYKIIGNGTVSTIVKNTKNEAVTLFCPESPEVLFQDFGKGKLVNGKVHIKLDKDFSKNIYVDEARPLRVFVQLEGNCKGVYVTNQTQEGFDVVELDGGQSDVSFSYFVSANRADDYDENGNLISSFAKVRFPAAPEMLEVVQKSNIKSIETLEEGKIKKQTINKRN